MSEVISIGQKTEPLYDIVFRVRSNTRSVFKLVVRYQRRHSTTKSRFIETVSTESSSCREDHSSSNAAVAQ